MDLINKFLNITVPFVALVTLPFFLPPYFLFKFLLSTIRNIFSEDVAGKVVLITGASSGIGEHLAYEYARKGACLALIARRELRLREVASQAELIGSPTAIVIPGDVTKVEDCKHFVEATVKHFGRLDHLVTNAGVAPVCMFEDYPDITRAAPAMDINFWGSAYSAYFAIPLLKQSKGKIIAIASAAGWLPVPRMTFYSASKAAVIALYETLRVEYGDDIGITIVTPGVIESEMTEEKFLNKAGKLEADKEIRDVQVSLMPVRSTKKCARAIVNSACRGDKYLTEPSWVRVTFFWKAFWPEIIVWFNNMLLVTGPGTSQRDAPSKKLLDLVKGIKEFLTPDTVSFHELTARLDHQRYRRSPF
ncbi:11-beta-hydroxysteroid dehydrogenase 1B-like [Pistacia vera]|uniref:11-beta-hydroxysteroid dehydrogenase 1B-like n=1 Tax=Pistacia vera TaxID=55513 RepID=UPI00126304FD|nr:11-beta-hydroxysteroid dehydrogenase 1B-like [Pistacia vera]